MRVNGFSLVQLTKVNKGQKDSEDDLSWDGILEDDLRTLRELIDKTKRSEGEDENRTSPRRSKRKLTRRKNDE